MQEEFYREYQKDKIQKLLMFTEMISFHALILLMNSDFDIKDIKVYDKEFERLLKNDFVNEKLYLEKKQTEEAQAAHEAKE